MKSIRFLCAAALLASGVPQTALAQINISATIANACSFGSVNVVLAGATIAAGTLLVDNSNTVTLTCNKGANVTVALNSGANASGTQKRLHDGSSNYINYNLIRPNPLVDGVNTCPGLPGTEWNATNTVVASALFATTGGPKAIPVCLSVPGSQFPAPGIYTDSVTASLTVL